MKKIILSLVCTFLTVQIYSQLAPCNPSISGLSYSTGSHTFCTPSTYNPGQSNYTSIVITAQYCSSYTFTADNGINTASVSVSFTPTTVGITTFTLYGTDLVNSCIQQISWSFTTVVCSATVPISEPPPVTTGIQIYSSPEIMPTYYDLRGNEINKRYNELIIEQIGVNRRKIFIIE